MKNIKPFLDMIAVSELGVDLLAKSDNGYNVIVGSTAKKPILFNSYKDHPRKLVDLGGGLKSTAAGRYQILTRYFDAYKKTLKLPDFSPLSQDKIAIQLITECKAFKLIESGDFSGAVKACASRWASLPGANYGQHENKLATLQGHYINAGGLIVT